ncbi:MAG: amidohydrolase family protein [Planctomycetota bacterium]
MKLAGQLMLPGEGQTVRLSPGVVEVEGPRIVAVTEGDIPDRADLGGPGCVICPGFIDAHVHLPQFSVIGRHGLGLLDWLKHHVFPAELTWADPVRAQAHSRATIQRMLGVGTTGFAAYATVHAEGALAALRAAEALGVRAWIGQVLMDQNAPEPMLRPADQLLAETAGLIEAYPPSWDEPLNRVSAAVTPRFAPTCSAELLRGAGELAQAHGCLVQTHLSETQDECRWVAELFDVDRYLDVYREAGLVTGMSVFGHGIYLDATDRVTLAQAGAAVAHCPTANRFLMSGRLDWTDFAGQPMALGSDIGAGYEVAMPRVARAMLENASELRINHPQRPLETLPSAAHAWWQITAGNAAALCWTDCGAISPGMGADLLVLRPIGVSGMNGDQLDLASLLWGWDDRWLEVVMLAGQV